MVAAKNFVRDCWSKRRDLLAHGFRNAEVGSGWQTAFTSDDPLQSGSEIRASTRRRSLLLLLRLLVLRGFLLLGRLLILRSLLLLGLSFLRRLLLLGLGLGGLLRRGLLLGNFYDVGGAGS